MFFAVRALDDTSKAALRTDHRLESVKFHLDHRPKVWSSGPLFSDDGKTPIGTLLIVSCEGRRQLETFLKTVPLFKYGLYKKIEVWPWRPVIYPGNVCES